jgi:hypothetical protein
MRVRTAASLTWVLVGIALVGCMFGGDSISSTPSATSSPLVRIYATPYPTPFAPTPRAPAGPTVTVERDLPSAGSPEADGLLAAIESHDIDELMRRIILYPLPCDGDFDPCPSDAPTPRSASDQRYAPGLAVQRCDQDSSLFETIWGTEPDLLRDVIEEALGASTRSFVQAVTYRPFSKAGDYHYTIAVGEAADPAPDARATIWQASDDAQIEKISLDCAWRGVAAVAGGGDPSRFLIPPRVTCNTGEATTTFEVAWRVYTASYPEFFGPEFDADGNATGRRVLVAIKPPGRGSDDYPVEIPESPPAIDTAFTGTLSNLGDIRPGMRLAVHGWRFSNCVVLAYSIAPAS